MRDDYVRRATRRAVLVWLVGASASLVATPADAKPRQRSSPDIYRDAY